MVDRLEKEEAILKQLASEWADSYRRKHLNPRATRKIHSDPKAGFTFILKRAFARAGGEQARYGDIALRALDVSCHEKGSYEKLVAHPNGGRIIWTNFARICARQRKKPYRAMNEGLILGLARLARNSPGLNPAARFEQLIHSGRVVDSYLTLVRVRGIGDKIARFLLRDLVVALNLEDEIKERDLPLLQPVDVWVRETACCLWPELKNAPDWFIAQYITEKCRLHGISSIRFNAGAWRFGQSRVKKSKLLSTALDRMAG
jgi:hypothetical protein